MRKFANSLAAGVFALGFASSAFGSSIIGDPTPGTLPGGAATDGYTGGVYADSAQTFGVAGTAISVTFNAGATGRELTFMVGTFSGNKFTPTGIFNDIVPTVTGVQTYNLGSVGLASGSSSVTAGETFGWTDQTIGSTSTYNAGTIPYGSGSYEYFVADASQNENPVVGTSIGNYPGGIFASRDYSVNLTVTPEPVSLALVGLGAIGLLKRAPRHRQA